MPTSTNQQFDQKLAKARQDAYKYKTWKTLVKETGLSESTLRKYKIAPGGANSKNGSSGVTATTPQVDLSSAASAATQTVTSSEYVPAPIPASKIADILLVGTKGYFPIKISRDADGMLYEALCESTGDRISVRDATASGEAFEAYMARRDFKDLAKSTDKNTTFTVHGTGLTVKGNPVGQPYSRTKYGWGGLKESDFEEDTTSLWAGDAPTLPVFEDWANSITASNDERNRSYPESKLNNLRGVHFPSEEEDFAGKTVSCDSYRGTITDPPVDLKTLNRTGGVTVPGSMLKKLVKASARLGLRGTRTQAPAAVETRIHGEDNSTITMSCGPVTVQNQLIPGEYPPLKPFLPKQTVCHSVFTDPIGASKWLQDIKKKADKNDFMIVVESGKMVASLKDFDRTKFGEYKLEGNPSTQGVETAINPSYLSDALLAVSEGDSRDTVSLSLAVNEKTDADQKEGTPNVRNCLTITAGDQRSVRSLPNPEGEGVTTVFVMPIRLQ